ncbi:MAG: sugar transporter [Holophagales bacterium]|nr:sugar transporter [Holophagales bacterium]MXX60991.1 sugar transporter [Holophagales bacterium]MYC11780.1 sugar transporter [Holophagales bacterium]MYD22311.1 sugar transporter [Holophagales bacterium]MYI34149.1 sugar transporter [Holophagales bacterium]
MDRLAFTASGTASGLVTNGVSYFLLIYYSQVIGLEPALAGSALLLALAFDAVSDPLVGRWSDRFRSRLGRRHPFLYAATLPAAASYYCLWTPPDLSQPAMFLWLLVFTITLRLAMTLHTVPFNALLPELAPDYDRRTRLMNYSYAGAWFFGTAIAVAMYLWWLADTPDYPDGAGILRRSGYEQAGLVTAAGVGLCLIAAAIATRRHIPNLATPPPGAASVATALAETTSTLRDRSLIAIVASTAFTAAASGTATAMWAYMQPWFWGFESSQTSTILATQLASPLIAFSLLPALSRGRDKKVLLIQVSILSMLAGSGPVILSLLGAFPPVGHAALFPLMTAIGVVQVSLIVMGGAISASMVADIVDARAVATGRREEGLVISVLSFTGKVATGMGVWIGGVLLSAIALPTGAAAAGIDRATIDRLGWLYGPVLALLYLIAIYALSRYRLSRHRHEENLAALAANGGTGPGSYRSGTSRGDPT